MRTETRFTSLAHMITPDFLKETWRMMNRKGASGVDGETTEEFEKQLDKRIRGLVERLENGHLQSTTSPKSRVFPKETVKRGHWAYRR